MPRPMTREDLDELQCQCGAKHGGYLHLSSRCHPGHPMSVTYVRVDGVIEISCATCGKLATRVVLPERTVRLARRLCKKATARCGDFFVDIMCAEVVKDWGLDQPTIVGIAMLLPSGRYALFIGFEPDVRHVERLLRKVIAKKKMR